MKRPVPALIAVLTTSALAAVAQPRGARAEEIAVFTKNTTNPFSRAIRAGSDFAAKQHGLGVSHYVPTTPDSVAEQTRLVDDAIAKKPDLIVFDPADNQKAVAAIEKINAAEIPVIDITDRAEGGRFVSAVLPDDYQLGVATARRLLTALDGKGSVVILEGLAATASSADRVRGFNDAIKAFPGVTLLASKSGSYQRKPAQDAMEGWIRQFPQIDGVIAANDSMAAAAVETLEKRGRKALVVGINGSKEAVEMIKADRMLATGEFNGFVIGCLAVEIAAGSLRKQPVPKEVVLKPVVYDKANVAGYEARADMRECPAMEEEMKN
jgi:ribose transport system substrate-binding protein